MSGKLSYARRLTLAYSGIFAVALLLFGGAAYGAVRFALQAAFDTRLSTTASAVTPIPDVRGGRIVFDPDDRVQFLSLLAENHLNGVTATRDGTVLLSNLAHPPPQVVAAVAGPVAHSGDVKIDRADVAFLSNPIYDGKRLLGDVAVWDARSVYDNAARLTLVALAAAGLVLVVAATAIGGTVIRRMLQPVAGLSEMISHIEASDLSERLQWAGPDDELGRLCAAFDRLLERLAATFDRERRFTADASHELRTPLSVMRAEIELALSQDRTPEAYRATLTRLEQETRRLESLAEALLAAARAGAEDAAPLAAVGLERVAGRAAERMRAPARQRGIRLDVSGSAVVGCEPASIENALVAVLDNALRFSPDGAVVRLDVRELDGTGAVAVLDEGPGFSDEALREATERFWRDRNAGAGSGAGLGLAIVRAIVERQRGELILRNVAGGGGVVELRLPLAGDGSAHGRIAKGDIATTAGSSAPTTQHD